MACSAKYSDRASRPGYLQFFVSFDGDLKLIFLEYFTNVLLNSLDLLWCSFEYAYDSNLFFSHKNLSQLEPIVNDELTHVHTWLCANKLSLNTVKSSFVLVHPSQRKIEASINLYI